MDNLPDEIKTRIFYSLGEAVAAGWSRLPQDVQHDLFERAVTAIGESMRQQIAVFLHEKHTRTTDAAKSRAMLEPDSPGG